MATDNVDEAEKIAGRKALIFCYGYDKFTDRLPRQYAVVSDVDDSDMRNRWFSIEFYETLGKTVEEIFNIRDLGQVTDEEWDRWWLEDQRAYALWLENDDAEARAVVQ